MDRYGNEHVLVVRRALFDELGSFQGLHFDTETYLPTFLDPANNFFLSRSLAERDPSHKQIIPYAVFHSQGRFLRYVRGRGGGEERLAAKASIGIGGHINTSDRDAAPRGRDTYMTGVVREVEEELRIECPYRHSIAALINDDSNDVGRVHLGVVHLFSLETEDVYANEPEITDLGFRTPAELREERHRLETWSQLCLDGLDRMVQILPSGSRSGDRSAEGAGPRHATNS